MILRIRRPSLILALMAALFAAISCKPPTTHSPSASSTSSNAKPSAAESNLTNRHVYQVKGVVRELMAERKKAKIAHEEIPGYMEAMTMVFDVKDANELKGLEVGDTIAFRLVVTEDDGWMEEVKKLEDPRTPLPADPTFRRARYVEALSVGDTVPDYTFTNMLGSVTKLSDYKGHAVGLTFIFTRCPFPTFCPRLNTTFQQAHAALKARSGGPTNWMLLSITMDPAYDTPARLRDYAKRYPMDTNHWVFVTGDLIDITAIGEQFGLQFWRPAPNDPISHNVRTVVIDATGRVQWITNENEFKPEELTEQMVRAAAAR